MNLVESTKGHGKIQLVDNTMVSNCDPTDLVEMAKQIQKVGNIFSSNKCTIEELLF